MTTELAAQSQTTEDYGRSIRRHVGRLLTGELASKAFRFAAAVVLARSLSASNFGLLNVGIAVSGIALVATSLGLPDLAARDAAIDPRRAGWLAGHVVAVRIAVLLAVSLAGIALGIAVWPSHADLLIVAAVMAMFMATQGDWLGRGLERMSLVALGSAAGGIAVLVGSLVAKQVSHSAAIALVAFAFGEGVEATVLWLGLRHVAPIEFGLRGMRQMVRRARPLALSSLAVYIYYANLDTIILAASHSTHDAGLYSAPYRLFLVLNLVGVFAGESILPVLARMAKTRDQLDIDRVVISALTALAGYGLVTLGLVEVVGKPLIGMLFGQHFRVASTTFVLLVSGVAWYAIGYPVGYSLIAAGKNARFLRGAATASIVNVTLNLALIPPLGMRGAGLATMVAFASAALVWLGAGGLISRATIPIVVLLSVTSVVAALVAFGVLSAIVAALATLGIAVLLLLSRPRHAMIDG